MCFFASEIDTLFTVLLSFTVLQPRTTRRKKIVLFGCRLKQNQNKHKQTIGRYSAEDKEKKKDRVGSIFIELSNAQR